MSDLRRAVTRARRISPGRRIGYGQRVRARRRANYKAPVAPARPAPFDLSPEPRPAHARPLREIKPMGAMRRITGYANSGYADLTPAQRRRTGRKLRRAQKGQQP